MISNSFDGGSREVSFDQLAFLHIPKTAGTSLTHVLASHWDCVRIIPNHEIVDSLKENELDKINLVAGHFYAHQLKHASLRRFTPITVLRDPIARLFSEYRFAFTSAENGEPLTVEMKYALDVSFFEYAFSRLGAVGRHPQLFIRGTVPGQVTPGFSPLGALFTSACAALNGMYVGLTEDLGAFVEKLFLQVGGPAPQIPLLNTQEKLLEDGLTQRQRETLSEVLAADYALYSFARDQMLMWMDGTTRDSHKANHRTILDAGKIPMIKPTSSEETVPSLFNQAVEGQDWVGVCQLLSKINVEQMTPALLEGFAKAALELEQPQYIAQVVRYAIMINLSIEERLRIARLFVVAKLVQDAWEIFVAGYHFLDHQDTSNEHLFITVVHLLVHNANAANAPDRLRQLVWHYRLRMQNMI